MKSELISASWSIDVTAVSSIVHKDDARSGGSIHTLFRREKIVTADGTIALVPIVSGNAWRGILRRIGEQLIGEVLDYSGALSTPAAYLLRNGGSLRKTATTLSAEGERALKTLVPLIGLFGGAANGRIMSGTAAVSKLVPITTDTAHLLPTTYPPATLSAIDILGQESFSHTADAPAGHPAATDDDDPRLRYDLETLIAGTRLHGNTHLTFATHLEYALFTDILHTFATTGHLGGRAAAGHGRIRATLTPTATTGTPPVDYDWRAAVADRRDEALAALAAII